MRTFRDHSSSSAPAKSASPRSTSTLQLKNKLRGLDLAAQDQLLSPVQAKGQPKDLDVHATAAAGVTGSGGSLPHLGAIQRSFGGHDVSAVQAHTGGAAKGAATSIGASAYATGDQVAFGESPDLHTAAHEAAHVVQQKAGVSLSGGVGQSGDRYEEHADRVADAVVQGKSAEGLLDQMAGGATVAMKSAKSRAPVQRKAAGSGLVSWEVVQGVFARLLKAKAAELQVSEDDPKAMDAAMAATRIQVGPGNYANWENRGSVEVGPVTEQTPTRPDEDDDVELSDAMRDPYAGARRRMDEMSQQANEIGQGVVAVERQVSRLKSPEGITGFMYEAGAGTMGLMYGVGANAAKFAKDQVDPVYWGMQAVAPGPSAAEVGSELKETASTSVDLMTGKLHDLYTQTRSGHAAYETASGEFSEARRAFLSSDQGLSGKWGEALKAAGAALEAMRTAAMSYKTLCDELGIPQKAMAMDKLDKAMVKGMNSAVQIAGSQLAKTLPGGSFGGAAKEVNTLRKVPAYVPEI